jgi:hypothetical protein
VGKFHIVVDPGNSSEEKILMDLRSGTTLSFSPGGRGADGTVSTSHAIGAQIWVCYTAVDADEANAHVNQALAAHTAAQVAFTPAGSLAATNVQTAIAELDSELDTRIDTLDTTLAALAAVDTALDVRLDALEATPDILSLTASAAANSAGGTLIFTWDAEVSDPSGFITAPSDTITVPTGLGGLYVIVLKTSGSPIGNYPIILINDGSNSSYVGGERADARMNMTVTVRLVATNTIKGLTINTSGSADSRGASLTLHRIAL